MGNRPMKLMKHVLVLELGKLPEGRIRLQASLPGREGVSSQEWAAGASWDDVRSALDLWVSQWLTLSDGWAERLPESPPR